MTSIRIDLLNPKGKKLLENLADLGIIAIRSSSKSDFKKLLEKLRNNGPKDLSLDEITKEVEAVRSERYGKKGE